MKREITPVLDTAAYADGDVLFAPILLTNLSGYAGQPVLWQSLHVVDASDQGAAIDLHFYQKQITSIGAPNAAFGVSDADNRFWEGSASVGTSDYYDCGGSRVAKIVNIGQILAPAQGEFGLWVMGVSRGAPTYAVDGLTLKFGFQRIGRGLSV